MAQVFGDGELVNLGVLSGDIDFLYGTDYTNYPLYLEHEAEGGFVTIPLILHADRIPGALQLVFDGAFSGTAATGGFAGSTVARIRSVVVLPAPFGPSRPFTPGANQASTPSSAMVDRNRLLSIVVPAVLLGVAGVQFEFRWIFPTEVEFDPQPATLGVNMPLWGWSEIRSRRGR